MWFFGKTYNTSHYYAMEQFNYMAYINGFFAAAYGDCEAFNNADREGLVFW